MQTLLLLTCLVCLPAESNRRAGEIISGAGVFPLFAAQVSTTIANLPPEVLDPLTTRGWKVEAVASLSGAIPELARQHPRGWPAGWTWANVDAVHLPTQRRLVFAQWRLGLSGHPVPSDRVAGVVRHEIGHAWDVAWPRGPYSDSDAFRAAYAADLASMSETERAELGYFIQATAAGRQETFAELFALHFGGGSAHGKQSALVVAFPRCRRELSRLFGHTQTAQATGFSAE